MEKQLRRRALHGAGWTIGGFGLSRVLRLLNHLILAWILAPQVFGLMTLVRIFKQGLEMFSDLGIRPSIIRSQRGLDSDFLNTAWTIQVIRGAGLWVASCVLAVPYAWIYSQNNSEATQLKYLIPVAGLSALIAGFQSTSLAILSRKLEVGKCTILEIKTQIVTLISIVVWALISPSIWAMIGGGIIGNIYQVYASYRIIPGHQVGFMFNQECARELYSFGKWIFFSTLFSFLAINIDKLALGNMLSLSELGVYGIAFVFSQVALDISMRLSNSVIFPVLAQLQTEPERLVRVSLKGRWVVLWVGGIACVCFAIFAPLFFETLWSIEYHSAGTIAQWLSIYVWCRILLNSMDRIPLALGNSRALFLSNVFQFLGIVPAAIGYTISGLSAFILGLSLGPLAAQVFLLRYLPSQGRELLSQSFRFTLVMVGIGATAVVGFSNLRPVISNSLWAAIVLVTCGILSLVAIATVGRLSGIQQLESFRWNRLSKILKQH